MESRTRISDVSNLNFNTLFHKFYTAFDFFHKRSALKQPGYNPPSTVFYQHRYLTSESRDYSEHYAEISHVYAALSSPDDGRRMQAIWSFLLTSVQTFPSQKSLFNQTIEIVFFKCPSLLPSIIHHPSTEAGIPPPPPHPPLGDNRSCAETSRWAILAEMPKRRNRLKRFRRRYSCLHGNWHTAHAQTVSGIAAATRPEQGRDDSRRACAHLKRDSLEILSITCRGGLCCPKRLQLVLEKQRLHILRATTVYTWVFSNSVRDWEWRMVPPTSLRRRQGVSIDGFVRKCP